MNVPCHKSILTLSASFIMYMSAAIAIAHGDHDDAELLARVSKAYAELTAKTKPAVVNIRVEKEVKTSSSRHSRGYNDPFGYFPDEFFRRFFDVPEQRSRKPRHLYGEGSGFLISRDGYILTNNHIVGDADKITVKTSDGRDFEAQLIGTDPESEVAVIKIEGDDFPYLEAGDSAELQIGEVVIAIGNPFGLNESVTFGHVSAKGRDEVRIADYENFIQTDASINPGNSGGPLINVKGEVIGINTAIYSKTGGNLGIGFAIPINMATSIKDQLIISGEVIRGYLGIGIQEVTPELAPHFELKNAEGIIIGAVEPGSAAEKAGLKTGEVILELNGNKVGGIGRFRNDIASHAPGSEQELVLIRDGKRETVPITIGQYEGNDSKLIEELGLELEDWNEKIAKQLAYSRGEGVFVVSVEPGSPAADARLMQGDLITSVHYVQVSTVDEFAHVIGKAKDHGHETVLLRVRRGRHATFISLKL